MSENSPPRRKMAETVSGPAMAGARRRGRRHAESGCAWAWRPYAHVHCGDRANGVHPAGAANPRRRRRLSRALGFIRQPQATGTWTGITLATHTGDAEAIRGDIAILQPVWVRFFGVERYLGMKMLQIHAPWWILKGRRPCCGPAGATHSRQSSCIPRRLHWRPPGSASKAGGPRALQTSRRDRRQGPPIRRLAAGRVRGRRQHSAAIPHRSAPSWPTPKHISAT